MRSRLNRFFVVLFLFFLLTGVCVQKMFPGKEWFAWIGSLVYFVTMVGWMFAHRGGSLDGATTQFVVLAWAGSMAMSLWSLFIPLCLPLSLLLGGYQGTWTALAVAIALTGLGLLQMAFGPKVRRVSVRIEGLAPELHGLKIAQISDLHVGPTVRRGYVDRVVRRLMATQPDLIAFTGDFADGHAESLKDHWEPLRRLWAPLGKFYVPGNHEYYWGADDWIGAAKQSGFTPLLNENRILKRGSAELLVGGVPDPMAEYFRDEKMDPKKAVEGGEDVPFKLLLSHRPQACEEGEKAGFHLQLSGHTHAGQYFPFNFLIPFFHTYYRGLNRHGAMWVYVNAGTGYWGPPNRFGISSEITLLTLTA